MLIIEGSDLVGKTTLIKALCDEATNQCYPMIPQHFGLLPNTWDFFTDYLPYIAPRTVMDRFIMSEVVYGEILRHHSRISPNYYYMLEHYLNSHDAVTVIVAAEPTFFETHVNRQYEHRIEVFKQDQICRVNQAFLEIINTNKLGDFEIQYDFAHVVNSDRDFPSSNKELVEEIIETYLKLKGIEYESTET